jgi:hypothetical protein
MTYRSRRGEKDPVTVADKSPEIAVANGYHITATPLIEGDTHARKVLNVVGEDDEKAVVLRDCMDTMRRTSCGSARTVLRS